MNVWLYDIAADSLTQLTADRNSRFARWINDNRVMFVRVDDWRHRPCGGSSARADQRRQPPMFVDADTPVYAYGANSGPDTDLYRARVGEMTKSKRWLERPVQQRGAELSPDCKWVAYVSDELIPNTFDLYLASTTTSSPFDTRPAILQNESWLRMHSPWPCLALRGQSTSRRPV